MIKSVKFKILFIFTLLFVVFSVNSIWAITNFKRLNNSIDNIMQANYKSIVAAQNMIQAIEKQNSLHLSDIFENQYKVNEFNKNQAEFMKWLAREEDNITEDGEGESAKRIGKLYQEYTEKCYTYKRIKEVQGIEKSKIYYYTDIFPVFERIKNECKNLSNINQNGMLTRKNIARDIAKRATILTLLISIVTILSGIVAALYFTNNKIVRPIYNLIGKMQRISDGDYTQQIDESGEDEISQLAKAFNKMTKKLKYYDFINVKKIMDEKQRAEGIIESIKDAIIVTDENNKIIMINRAAEENLNIRYKNAFNKHFLEVIKREDIFKNLEEAINETDEDDNGYMDIDIKNNDKTNYFRVNSTPIFGKEGCKIGVVTSMIDITKLKEVDNLKSDFVSTVSHEFRTPLTSISMSTGLLLDNIVGDINEDQRELISAIKEDQERLTSLVKDLLDLSKIQSGKIQMDIKPCDIKEIINNVKNSFKIQYEEGNVALNISELSDDSCVVCDYNKISWVLTNLLSNALRFVSADGEGIVNIGTKSNGDKLLVYVNDNGKGIPEEYRESIFEKFIQVKDKNGEAFGGTGLGLAICKEIVNAHRGEIWVNSSINEGSTFYFSLEIKK